MTTQIFAYDANSNPKYLGFTTDPEVNIVEDQTVEMDGKLYRVSKIDFLFKPAGEPIDVTMRVYLRYLGEVTV